MNMIYRIVLFVGLLFCLTTVFVVMSETKSYAKSTLYSYHYDTDKYCIRCRDVVTDADKLRKSSYSSWKKLILNNAGVQVYARNSSDNKALKRLAFDYSDVKAKVTTSGYSVKIQLPGLTKSQKIPIQFKVYTYENIVIKNILPSKTQIVDELIKEKPEMNTEAADSTSSPDNTVRSPAPGKKANSVVRNNGQEVKKEPTIERADRIEKKAVPLVTEEPSDGLTLTEKIPRVGIPLSAILLLILLLVLISDIRVLHWYKKRKQAYYEKGKML